MEDNQLSKSNNRESSQNIIKESQTVPPNGVFKTDNIFTDQYFQAYQNSEQPIMNNMNSQIKAYNELVGIRLS